MDPTDDLNGFRTILAWVFTIVLIALFDRSRFGHVLLSYMLISIILVTVLQSASSITWIVAPFAANQAQSVPPEAQQ